MLFASDDHCPLMREQPEQIADFQWARLRLPTGDEWYSLTDARWVSLPGVYVIWHPGVWVLYAGETRRISTRLESHFRKLRREYSTYELRFTFTHLNRREALLGVEQYLFDKFKPVLGKRPPHHAPIAVQLPAIDVPMPYALLS